MPESRDFQNELARLRDEMNQILNNSVEEIHQSEPLSESEWFPALDVLENKDDIIVKADIPGMNPENIELSILGDILQISGMRKQEIDRKDENYHILERGYGKFNRRIPLPAPVSDENITANYTKGVLIVKLPKLSQEKTEEIKVSLE